MRSMFINRKFEIVCGQCGEVTSLHENGIIDALKMMMRGDFDHCPHCHHEIRIVLPQESREVHGAKSVTERRLGRISSNITIAPIKAILEGCDNDLRWSP